MNFDEYSYLIRIIDKKKDLYLNSRLALKKDNIYMFASS